MAIGVDGDVVAARRSARALAIEQGLSPADATIVATIVSGLARHVLAHARPGEISLSGVTRAGRRGIAITARDEHGEFVDLGRLSADAVSAVGGPGIDAADARPLLHRLEIVTEPGQCTTITATRWKGQ